MNTVVLVPRRSDGGRRDEVWAWIKDRWTTEHPDWLIVEGHHDTGVFNRSAARNDAARQAGDWDAAILADADSFVPVQQAIDMVELAAKTGQITVGHSRYMYLDHDMSDQVMDGYVGPWHEGIRFAMVHTCSSIVAIRRDLWDTVGGFDEGFEGWGYEDTAFFDACTSLGGGAQRVPGPVWHLWHPVAPDNDPSTDAYQANGERVQRYHAAKHDPSAMRALLAELQA